MAVSQFYRNQFTSLEVGKRASKPPRACADCGTGIDSMGGKRRCGPCSAIRQEGQIAACQRKYRLTRAK